MEKRGKQTKILKMRGGQAGSRGECLKKKKGGKGSWNPLTNYAHKSLQKVLL